MLRLVEEGDRALASVEVQLRDEGRRDRVRNALERIASLVDRKLLLSDRAWS